MKNLPDYILKFPESDYHGMKEFLSNSMLTHFLRSPAHFQDYLNNPPEQTKSMALGSLIHLAVLEPKRMDNVAVMPECDRRTKEGKATYAEFCEKNAGKMIVSQEDYDLAKTAVGSAYSHSIASELLDGADIEASIFFEKDGVKCRSRIDAYNNGTLIDVKTTDDARPGSFIRSIANYGYHRQMAFYSMALAAVGKPVEKIRIIAIENKGRCAVNVIEIDPPSFWKGQQEIEDAIQRFKKCQETGVWPAYDEIVHLVGLPAYAL